MSLKKSTKIFLGTTSAVFFVLFGIVVVLTLLKPKIYAGTARVRLKNSSQAAFAAQTNAVLSEAILNPVVETLHLNAAWGRKIRVDDELKTWESVTLLRQHLQATPVPNTSDLEIRVEDDDSAQAAKIANQIAENLSAHDAANSLELVQRAQPEGTPVWPSYPLFFGVGAILCIAISLAIGRTAGLMVDAVEKGAKKLEEKQA